MTKKRSKLNVRTFAIDAAAGRLDEDQLATKHGISADKAFDLLSGRSRPHVAARIAELSADHSRVAWQRLQRLQGKAVSTLSAAMREEVRPAALAAAKEVIGCTMKASSRRKRADRPTRAAAPRLPRLSPEEIRQVELDLDGPAARGQAGGGVAGRGGPQE